MNPSDSQRDYAFWTIPGTSFTVTYSLGVFQEIDFEVNEGFRRIPHGGMEVGGVLWGRMKDDSVVIESFRPIQCEHELGPSFVLSERDLAELKEQLARDANDSELAGMTAVGWFVARTRTHLAMLDRDAALFDRFFPLPGSITLLVKPERFQPTRFSFIVRSGNGQVDRDTAQHAVILPLAGRSSQPNSAPIASIVAPVERSIASESASRSTSPPAQPPSPKPDQPPRLPLPEDRSNIPATVQPNVPSLAQPPVEAKVQPPVHPRIQVNDEPRPAVSPQAVPSKEEEPAEHKSPQLSARERQAITRPRTEVSTEADSVTERPVIPPAPVRPSALPSIDEVKKRRAEIFGNEEDPNRPGNPATRGIGASAPSNLRLLAVLLIAGLLGCGTGYLAYLQLPAPIIQMHVQRQGTKLIIFWPADQTRNSSYAAIRVDDGHAVLLTAEEKAAGHMELDSTSDNVKLELIAQHWIRDSRGIMRYVRRVSPAAPAVAPTTAPVVSPSASDSGALPLDR